MRLGNISNINGGFAFKSTKYVPNGVRVIRISDFDELGIKNKNIVRYSFSKELLPYELEKNNIILAMTGGTVGKSYLVEHLDEPMYVNQRVATIKILNPLEIKYINTVILSDITQKIIKYSKNSTNDNISMDTIKGFLFPLPPISEQERIVKKIEELEPFIEEYGKAEVELTTLNSNFPEQIKKSILQYAIQGKLVEQDLNDEPASVLLEKIRAEKQELIKQGKIKKDKQESYIFKGADNRHYEKIGLETKDITDEIPFDIPSNWEWCRLGSVSKYIQRGKSPKYSEIMKIPVISQKCNKWEIFDIKQAKFIQEDSLSSYSEDRLLIDGDILWNSTGTGTVGRLAIYYDKLNPYKIAVADSHVTVIRLCSINSQYIYYYLSSPQVQIGIEDICDGSTNQKELSLTTVKEYLIPIPPLKEQERIVAKIKRIKKYIENL